MSFSPNDEVIVEFRQEATEALEMAELALLDVEQGRAFLSKYNEIFRCFHSIKGAAGMFGMDKLQKHVHHMESLLEKVKIKNSFAPALMDYFLKGIDATKEYLEGGSPEFPLIDPLIENNQTDKFKESVKQRAAERRVEKKPTLGLVMLVDDEPVQLQLMIETVESSGFEVRGFSKGKDLLKELEKKLPDVVLTDLRMPEMNGLELLKHIHKIDPDLPVVFLSGYLGKEECIEGLSHGAYAFIEKPFNEAKVLNVLINAAKVHRTMKFINQSINFIFYQFSDIDSLLKSQGKEAIRQSIEEELKNLLAQRRELKQLKLYQK